MRRLYTTWAGAALAISAGLLGSTACDSVPLPEGVSTSQPVGADAGLGAGLVKLQLRNLSGLPVSVEEIYVIRDEQVRVTKRYLPASGPDSIAEGVWTYADAITIRVMVAPDAPEEVTLDSNAKSGELLAARVFRFEEDFEPGETILFDILPPAPPPADIIDCNANGINDPLDLASGQSDDCDSDTVPDECQVDTDSDSFIDPCDECPDNPDKHEAGACGCDAPETGDDDGDGTADCVDTCTDTDSDGFGDPGYPANTCPEDDCPSDAQKHEPGICGCGVPDAGDADSDGVLDCVDQCPGSDDHADCNSNGVPDGCDADDDTDGLIDECDDCPNDPDNDDDGDGVCGDVDICPTGDDHLDADDDGIPDACDDCPDDGANDADKDGVCGDKDHCPDTSAEEAADADGCSCSQSSVVHATVRLIGVDAGEGKTRCIKFTPLCGSMPQPPIDLQVVFTGSPATGTAVFSLPCQDGCYTCLCAKDEQHTFPSTQLLQVVDHHYETVAPLDLYGGDDDNNGALDINDVTLLVAQNGLSAIDAGCPASGVGPTGANRDADFDLSGTVRMSSDYAFFTQALAHFNGGVFPIQPMSCGCEAGPALVMAGARSGGSSTSIPVNELDPDIAAGADLNADGIFDYQDVEIYEAQNGLANELSQAILMASLDQGD